MDIGYQGYPVLPRQTEPLEHPNHRPGARRYPLLADLQAFEPGLRQVSDQRQLSSVRQKLSDPPPVTEQVSVENGLSQIVSLRSTLRCQKLDGEFQNRKSLRKLENRAVKIMFLDGAKSTVMWLAGV